MRRKGRAILGGACTTTAIIAFATFLTRNASAKACWATADDIDGGVTPIECADASVMPLDGGGGADDPPPPTWPQPPIPDPIDVECEDCKTPPTTEKLPALPFPTLMWSFPMEKMCGPGQTLGFSLTGDLEGETTKAPCSCYEKSHINIGLGTHPAPPKDAGTKKEAGPNDHCTLTMSYTPSTNDASCFQINDARTCAGSFPFTGIAKCGNGCVPIAGGGKDIHVSCGTWTACKWDDKATKLPCSDKDKATVDPNISGACQANLAKMNPADYCRAP